MALAFILSPVSEAKANSCDSVVLDLVCSNGQVLRGIDSNGNKICVAAAQSAPNWVNVTNTTTPFNPQCEYRWLTSQNVMYYPTGVWTDKLGLDYSGNNNVYVHSNNKGVGGITMYEKCS